MIIKYNINIDNYILCSSFKKIINQTYKLLPMREQGQEWTKPLETIIQELSGMKRLFMGQEKDLFFLILCKMEGLFCLDRAEDMNLYRRTIFECLRLLSTLRMEICKI